MGGKRDYKIFNRPSGNYGRNNRLFVVGNVLRWADHSAGGHTGDRGATEHHQPARHGQQRVLQHLHLRTASTGYRRRFTAALVSWSGSEQLGFRTPEKYGPHGASKPGIPRR